jgi:ribosomal-protein-alanine N-acetyltransferase
VALLNCGFVELGLNRVVADIDPRNINSAKSLERIGFAKEGHLRESRVVNGMLTDSALYGLLQREWKGV